ncbi:asparagine synthase-related protein [Streptomyces zagrosensis]|uniref:Asparagine synthase (Glutamine-hydrolyzing) n=1 Tax=Streptomyces zagrosensis TaxID=1042984 RepID=A0A7W9Q572_9ACTN|nr:asparagine synthase-related protein [Streptomyces zagrosensis]MBB5933845.1 asparagine synthase (glutamine-hydrolyzing) [Streptomyces zagrosensis]
MIKLRLTPYANTAWAWDTTTGLYRTADGQSEITPYGHPMLEHLGLTDGTRTLVVVRERTAGRAVARPEPRTLTAADFDAARTTAVTWPLDYVLVETAPGVPVRVTAGPCGIAPLYVAHDATTLFGSWDMADLAQHARTLSPREVARLLIYRPRYSQETVFQGIHRVTERATAHFGGHLHVQYPEPALHSGPRELADTADVLGAFVAAMDDALDARPLDAEATVFHLTGGFDSGTVATRAAERLPGQYATSTLLIAGPGRESQLRRRAQIRDAVSFAGTDLIVDATETGVLAPGCVRRSGGRISPYEEPLHHPFTRMTQLIAQHGARTVVTGLGGDEMVALSQQEYPHKPMGEISDGLTWIGARARAALEFADDAIAPPARVNSMTLLSLETTAPVLLRAGIWPVHPFTDPDMIQLGEWLPYDWRELKQLQRRRLAALGLGPDVTQSRTRESFAEVVQHALTTEARPLFDAILKDGSPLFEEGLIDPDGLRDGLRQLDSGPYREDGDAQLLEVIDLHLAAAAFL